MHVHWVKLWSLAGISAIFQVLLAVAVLLLWNRYIHARGRVMAIALATCCLTIAFGWASQAEVVTRIGFFGFAVYFSVMAFFTFREKR